MYEFKGIQIEDHFDPVAGELDSYFRRTLTFESPNSVKNLWFRAATGNISQKGNVYLLDNKVTFKFSGAAPLLRDNKELLVPINFNGSRATLVEEIIW